MDPVQFESNADLSFAVGTPYANFVLNSSGEPAIAHQDFSGPVTRDNPAHPSELLHLYMTGLGPVSPAVASGAPAPSIPPARATLPFACYFPVYPSVSVQADIPFAGLAPNYAGYYQVELQLPLYVPSNDGQNWLYCWANGSYSGASAQIPLAPR